jgi:hypothetical protein
MSKCSPKRENLQTVCLTTDELENVATMYNQETKKDAMNILKYRRVLLRNLTAVFKDKCKKNDDKCWIEQSPDTVKIYKNNYRPDMPKSWITNEREWLNTNDIMDVMKQYEEKHKSFKFLGVFSSDFASKENNVCTSTKMCQFSAVELKEKEKKTEFGVVLNLDEMNQPGSHWVSIFCSLNPKSPKYGIAYYDSGGKRPLPKIDEFMTNVTIDMKDPAFVKKWNNKKHQNASTECGIFSMLFIIQCLKTKRGYDSVRESIDALVDNNDDKVHAYRKELYSRANKSI